MKKTTVMDKEIALNEHPYATAVRSPLKGVNKPIYSSFFATNDFVQDLERQGRLYPSVWRGRDSSNSLNLKPKNADKSRISNILIDVFNIENTAQFREKYNQAVSGDGLEWKRITTLHSSSLLALLCFYSVSESHKLTIGKYEFTESFFEVKTRVYRKSKSNMDVVLRGIDKDSGQKVALFLECKFSEYLNCGKIDGISRDAYLDSYQRLGLFDPNNAIPHVEFNDCLDCIAILPRNEKQNPIYCAGIKQMLSHYIGVSHYASKRGEALVEGHPAFVANNEEKVLLGELIFDFQNNEVAQSGAKLRNYRATYKGLAARLNTENKIMLLDEILTYQEVFGQKCSGGFLLEDNVMQFYRL